MVLFKVKYSCIHTDNHQGAMGKVVVSNEYIKYDDESTLFDAMQYAKTHIAQMTRKENFPIENPRIISIEIVEPV
jgi:hypothetical protein